MGKKIGEIENNSNIGVYGKVTNVDFINSIKQEELEVAERNEIKTGKAEIICQLENDKVERFEII